MEIVARNSPVFNKGNTMIYSITYSDKYQRATLRNHGCNYRCIGCSYKLKSPEKPVSHLSLDSIRDCLRSLPLREVSFMGGEPTLNPELPELLSFCKNELGALTRLGHTNGSNLIIENLDASNVTLKAYDDELYLDYTGKPAGPVYENFRVACEAGLEMKASSVLIPEYCDMEQLEKIAVFVSGIGRDIPFHLMGYIPVPGTPWRRPDRTEMKKAVSMIGHYLSHVTFSHLTSSQFVNGERADDIFQVRRVL